MSGICGKRDDDAESGRRAVVLSKEPEDLLERCFAASRALSAVGSQHTNRQSPSKVKRMRKAHQLFV
jgi:hypothetical protein